MTKFMNKNIKSRIMIVRKIHIIILGGNAVYFCLIINERPLMGPKDGIPVIGWYAVYDKGNVIYVSVIIII